MFAAICATAFCQGNTNQYEPAKENLEARQVFSDSKFGIFLHWGLYSMFAQGEWYLNNANIDAKEYAKSASAFYPIKFNAKEWVAAFKDAGAKYVCITSRHHDGFSLWDTKHSEYDIIDATPFGRDIIKELSEECHKQGIRLHLYYSHLDWTREDYPLGKTGHGTGRDKSKANWASYYQFMNNQLTELLTNYGEIGAIWFDGVWDHENDAVPFDWKLEEQYRLIHSIQPACLIGNNHHVNPVPGEDFQIFECDLPGENKAGFSARQSVTSLPLETCHTINGNGVWGYQVADRNYKTADNIILNLLNTAGRGANLLFNIGPQPNGELPEVALKRLKEVGEWTRTYGETIYATKAGDVEPQTWGVTTRKGNRLFVHIIDKDIKELFLPLGCKVKKAFEYVSKTPVKVKKTKGGVNLILDRQKEEVDFVIELVTQ